MSIGIITSRMDYVHVEITGEVKQRLFEVYDYSLYLNVKFLLLANTNAFPMILNFMEMLFH